MYFIRIRFIASSGFIGSAIRYFTGSLFSHVEFGTPQGTWIGAHIGSGWQERPFDYCRPEREYVYEIPCTAWQERKLLRWARSQVGVKYNTLDIVGLMFHARGLRSPGRYICSQGCTEGLLNVFGAAKVLNVLAEYDYLITPETMHLSPIFVGNLKSKKG